MTDIRAFTQALAEARTAETRARQDRDEVLSDSAFTPAFEALREADLTLANARNHAAATESDLRLAIEAHYTETGEGPGIDGLGIQWRSELAYEDSDVVYWIEHDFLRDVKAANAIRAWLLEVIAKHRLALNRIILAYRPSFADCSSKRLVPTISDRLNAKLEAAANPPPESMAEWQARDRRKHGEAISKLVAEQWGEKA